MFEDRLRKWVFVGLGVLFAVQLYFVQELVAALLLFGALFLAFAAVASLIFVVHEGGQRAVGWAELQWRATLANSRRVLAFASAFSKKPSHHPHSRPVP